MTNTAGGGMRIGNNGHLTIATGGSMNLPGFDMPESGAGGHLTIEAGSTARVDRYWNDEASPSYINQWIADASGVTTFQIDGKFTLRGTSSILDVDLSNYDIANGTTLVLVDYGSLGLQSQGAGDNGWATMTLTAGWTADLDLTTGNEIRLINIVEPDTTPPVISLVGDDPMDVVLGSSFTDPGATASDNRDGVITDDIVVTGSVDADTAGAYILSYDVSDAADNDATTVTRTVNVNASILTWDDGAGDDSWSSAANWDLAGGGDPAAGPVNGDSVILTTTAQSVLDGAWTIVSGASLTSATSGYGDELVLQSDSDLTLATGGTMDIGFMRPRFSSGGQFTIEAGASLDTDNYGLGTIEATVTFEADSSGVTLWNTSGAFDPRLDNLVVDLSNYDMNNGDLVLVDYGTLGAGYEFASVTVFGGLTGSIDYAYDQGGGDLAIAITGIGVPGTIFKFK